MSEIEELLDNHRRYYKDTHHKRKTLSLEGLYIPERVDENDDDVPPVAYKPIDQKQAIEVEKIVISLPKQFKLPLVIEMFYRFLLNEKNVHRFRKTCRKNGINPRNWDSDVKKAKLMVWNKYIKNN